MNDIDRDARKITGAQTIGDPTSLRTFRVRTIVEEIGRHKDGTEFVADEPLASIGETVVAEDFSKALPALDKALNAQWHTVGNMASIIDMEPAPLPPYVAPEDDAAPTGGWLKRLFTGRKGK